MRSTVNIMYEYKNKSSKYIILCVFSFSIRIQFVGFAVE